MDKVAALRHPIERHMGRATSGSPRRPKMWETIASGRRGIPGREVRAIATPQIEAVIERLAADKAFRVKYCQDPDEALGAYHLSADEIRAIKTGDDRLLELIDGNRWEELIKALCGPHPGP